MLRELRDEMRQFWPKKIADGSLCFPSHDWASRIESIAADLSRPSERVALALEEAAKIADGVDNYANPMTAGDVADAIRALKPLPVPVAANEGAT